MICGAGGGGFLQAILKKGCTKEQLRERIHSVFQDSGVDVWGLRVSIRKIILKVLQINTICGSGSVGRITVDIVHALEAQGDEGMVAFGRRSGAGGGADL